MSYVIEDGVPRDTKYGRRTPVTQALEALQPEQSFVVGSYEEYIKARGSLSRLKPKKFSVRKLGHDGWRIWRIV